MGLLSTLGSLTGSSLPVYTRSTDLRQSVSKLHPASGPLHKLVPLSATFLPLLFSTRPTPSSSRCQHEHQPPGATSFCQALLTLPPTPYKVPHTCPSPCNSNRTVVLRYLFVSPTGPGALYGQGPHSSYSPWFSQLLAQDLTDIFVEQINK